MKNICHIFIPIFVFIILWKPAVAEIIIIPDDYPAIQQGIDAAQDGDTILIRPGIYFENILVESKNLIIGSLFLITSDTSFISQTILNGNQAGSVIRLSNIISGLKISGITVTNGRSATGGGIYIVNSEIKLDNIHILENISICGTRSNVGGGIACFDSQLEIRDFIIKDNFADCSIPPINPYGGGLYARNSFIQLIGGVVLNNEAFLGGGLFLDSGCDLMISDVIFNNNYAPNPGGAICAFDTDMDIQQTVFDSNGDWGGAIFADNSEEESFNLRLSNCLFINNNSVIDIMGHCLFEVTNCTFTDNYGSRSILFQGNDLQIINSIFWNDFPQEIQIESSNFAAFIGYSDIKGGKDGVFNNGTVNWIGPVYDTLPGFVNDSVFQLSDNSPCIGAGIDSLNIYPNLTAPVVDLDSNTRPNPTGSMPDLGAYENLLANPLTGIYEQNSFNTQATFKIYPNPAGRYVNIINQSGETVHSIQFTDVSGRELLKLSGIYLLNDHEFFIETRQIKGRGLIFVVLWTDDHRFYRKLILNDL
jgi:predicted outer membrane repeat protein